MYFEYTRPKPLDWRQTLSSQDKIPYGTYVLYDGLPQVLGTDSVETLRQPIYNQLLGNEEPDGRRGRSQNVDFGDDEDATTTSDTTTTATDTSDSTTTTSEAGDSTATTSDEGGSGNENGSDSTATAGTDSDSTAVEIDPDEANDEAAAQAEANATPLARTRAHYIFINSSFSASKLETNALLRFVGAGHDVFIAAEDIGGSGRGRRLTLADTLGVRLYQPDSLLTDVVQNATTGRQDSVTLHLLRPRPGLAATSFRFLASAASYRLGLRPDSTGHSGAQGATLAADAQGRPVLLRLNVGRGHVYLCSVPLAFGNYWVLRPRTADFAFAALSYLPAGHPAWWDEYQKQGRAGEQSLLHVVIDSPALRPAYYLLLVAGLLFVFVRARRLQRVIPTLKPLPNTTLLFTRTVAGLYRQGSNHQLIAEKKAALFADYLRTRFQEPAVDLGAPVFRERLSQKSGVPQERVDALARLINFARTAPAVSDRELLILSRAMQDFKREAG